jgi:hypothetical protein
MKKLLALLSVVIVIVSCRPKSGMDADIGYFSMAGFVAELCKGNPVYQFKKTLFVEGKSETQTITDTLKKQISFFDHFEINKPSYRDAYTVKITLAEDTIGQTVKDTDYNLKADFKYPVKEFRLSVSGNTTTINATSIEKNLLTLTTKQLHVVSDDKGFVSYSYSIAEDLRGGSPSSTKIVLERIK